MGSIYLDWMADEVRQAYSSVGLDPGLVVEVDRVSGGTIYEGKGWVYRSRSSGGYSAPAPLCVMWHHTAVACSSTSRAGLLNHAINTADARPVANIYLWCDATCYVLAGGATNTNGSGNGQQFSRGYVPDDGMNSRAVGVEIVNDGVGGPYSEVQIRAAFAISNAVNAKVGNLPSDVQTHYGYAPTRKIDPATATAVQGGWQPRSCTSSGTWNTSDLRTECERRWYSPTPEPTEEDVHPVICSRGEGQLDMLSTGSDGQVYHRWWAQGSNDGNWSEWSCLGGQLVGPPTAIGSAVSPGRLDVFGVGLDGNIWQCVWDGHNWSGWFPQGTAP